MSVRLPNEITDRLNDLAKKTVRTKSLYLREAILKHLEQLEDIHFAEKELSKFDKPVAKRIHDFLTIRVSANLAPRRLSIS